ncbi:MAG: helix-turn-helix transcriptional regulator [Actinobacteria bacterium]|nr:helix-turn-helix transcriptional regulator [Actinomycetota bacterium]
MRDEFLLDDVHVIRALAHPLRIRMLSMLQQEGPATSTTLSRALGESTGNTSYHLRQLARHGLVEENTERGDRRDRWWTAAARHYNLAPALDGSPEHKAAIAGLRARVLEHDAVIVASFFEHEDIFESAVRDEATFTNHVVYATPEELTTIRAKISDIFREFERPDPASRPDCADRWYGVLRLVPWKPERSRKS